MVPVIVQVWALSGLCGEWGVWFGLVVGGETAPKDRRRDLQSAPAVFVEFPETGIWVKES